MIFSKQNEVCIAAGCFAVEEKWGAGDGGRGRERGFGREGEREGYVGDVWGVGAL